MDTDDTTASAGQKKAGQWPAAYYRAPCYEFRESDRANKFYRPRSPPSSSFSKPHLSPWVVARASRPCVSVRPQPRLSLPYTGETPVPLLIDYGPAALRPSAVQQLFFL